MTLICNMKYVLYHAYYDQIMLLDAHEDGFTHLYIPRDKERRTYRFNYVLPTIADHEGIVDFKAMGIEFIGEY